ncbi:MAG: exosortase/archaeosortase family protein [Bacteroidales bacterium]|nr:exosortase/archaeosortase family protein [Bacteroidales bacterium]
MKLTKAVFSKLNKKQKQSLGDILLFMLATVIFHILYWYSDMNFWLFGPFTYEVFDFFTNIAFNISRWVMSLFDTDFLIHGRTFWFYYIDANGIERFFRSMTIVHDCSGIKQMMQVFIFMLLVRGNWWKRLVYWLCCCLVIIVLNVVRIVGLTVILIHYPNWFQPLHDWVGRPFMYVFIFLMWVVWTEFFARRSLTHKAHGSNLTSQRGIKF